MEDCNVADLLFELGTEELPPKSLKNIIKSFKNSVEKSLDKEKISYLKVETFYSPRRLILTISNLHEKQADSKITRLGPMLVNCYDDDGKKTPMAIGFAKSCNLNLEDIEVVESDKGQRLSFTIFQTGKKSTDYIADIIKTALKKLPIDRLMKWGDGEHSFVRPVKWSLLMYNNKIIDTEFYGKKTSNITYGHRFLSSGSISIEKTSDYFLLLKEKGIVIADNNERYDILIQQINDIATKNQASIITNNNLNDEINGIVEYPVALTAEFDTDFLKIPKEALIISMQSHQKCIPMLSENNELLNKYIIISNIISNNPDSVISGNEKVINARFQDAKFFWETDLEIDLKNNLDGLKKVLFHPKLGNLADKSYRISNSAEQIARLLNADESLAKEAGLLSKCDLISNMVGEFPSLQGIMGSYYAKNQGYSAEVLLAIQEQYSPKFSGDNLPENNISISVALAEKLDSLIGLFGIGHIPSGDKDPFALRRNAIGVLRILKENKLNLDLEELIDISIKGYNCDLKSNTKDNLTVFFSDRLQGIYLQEGVSIETFQAVNASNFSSIADFDSKISAIKYFLTLESSSSLAQANKRVANILKNNNKNFIIDKTYFDTKAEHNLYNELILVENDIKILLTGKSYSQVLDKLLTLNKPIQNFFDNVMVLVDDERLKNNRLALLQKINFMFMQIADISLLCI